MIARYDGTCAATGRAYEAGAHIKKVGSGWVLDDAVTHQAVEARTAAFRITEGGQIVFDVPGHPRRPSYHQM